MNHSALYSAIEDKSIKQRRKIKLYGSILEYIHIRLRSQSVDSIKTKHAVISNLSIRVNMVSDILVAATVTCSSSLLILAIESVSNNIDALL